LMALGKTREPEIVEALEELKLEGSERAFRLIEQVNGWTIVTGQRVLRRGCGSYSRRASRCG